jgi:hypothetical protein
VVGDGEAAYGHRHLGAVAHSGLRVAPGRGGVDDPSGESADAEQRGECGGDAGELGGNHAIISCRNDTGWGYALIMGRHDSDTPPGV